MRHEPYFVFLIACVMDDKGIRDNDKVIAGFQKLWKKKKEYDLVYDFWYSHQEESWEALVREKIASLLR